MAIRIAKLRGRAPQVCALTMFVPQLKSLVVVMGVIQRPAMMGWLAQKTCVLLSHPCVFTVSALSVVLRMWIVMMGPRVLRIGAINRQGNVRNYPSWGVVRKLLIAMMTIPAPLKTVMPAYVFFRR